MKYSLRKSFRSRRRTELQEDEQVYPRLDAHGCSNSNSNLVKSQKKSKTFLGRRSRHSSSPPPPASMIPPSPPSKTKTKSNPSNGYSEHVNDDDDDDPFAPPTPTNARTRPLDRLTYQLRKSFRNTLTRQRPRLESTNSNKRLLSNTTEIPAANPPDLSVVPISTGLTSQFISPTETISSDQSDKIPAPTKRRKAPLAPHHIHQSYVRRRKKITPLIGLFHSSSASVPNPDCSTLNINDNPESGYGSSPNEQMEKMTNPKKNKLNQSFRSRISLLLKKRHEKRQQTPNIFDEETEPVHPPDENEEVETKKGGLGQKFDTLRRSFHFGKRNSTSKGKGHLLLNE